MIIKCSNCKIEFNKKEYLIARGSKNNFCGNSCKFEYYKHVKSPRSNSIQTNCSYCKSQIIIKKSQFERAELHFCNIDCKHKFNKENNFWGKLPHNYQGEVVVKCAYCETEFKIKSGHYNSNKKNRGGNVFCSKKCVGKYNQKYFSGENSHKYGKEGLCGELNPAWKGGITPFIKSVRLCGEYYRWKNTVILRDDYKCTSCNSDNNLIVHHIIPLIEIVKQNNIVNMKQAKECKELWDISNGITLCKTCHKIEHQQTRKFI